MFGPDVEAKADGDEPTLPDWLVGRVGEAAELEEGDHVILEGEIRGKREPATASDSSTPDDLAFYLPFHFYGDDWGIYVRASGVTALAKRIATPRIDMNAMLASYLVLIEHERMHFTAEYAASRIEVITANSSYREYFREEAARKHEEALANANAVVKLRRWAQLRTVKVVTEWMNQQPAGYRDFGQCMPPRFVAAERKATVSMNIVAFATNKLLGADNHPAEFVFRRSPQRIVPIY